MRIVALALSLLAGWAADAHANRALPPLSHHHTRAKRPHDLPLPHPICRRRDQPRKRSRWITSASGRRGSHAVSSSIGLLRKAAGCPTHR